MSEKIAELREANIRAGEFVWSAWKKANLNMPTSDLGAPYVLQAILEQRKETGLSIGQIHEGYCLACCQKTKDSVRIGRRAHDAYNVSHEVVEADIKWIERSFWGWSISLGTYLDGLIHPSNWNGFLSIIGLQRWKRYEGDRLQLLLSTVQAITAVYDSPDMKRALAENRYYNAQNPIPGISHKEKLGRLDSKIGETSRSLVRSNLAALELNRNQIENILRAPSSIAL